jgi:hypothetical protein
LDVFYELQNKENKIGNFKHCKIDLVPPFLCGREKITVNGEFRFIKINSMAIPSSVGFQMLEGLQTGQTLRGDYFTKKTLPNSWIST